MASETVLNYYYNRGGFNKPSRIGYVMKMIRDVKPLTEREWYLWYITNVHDSDYLSGLAKEMHEYIPAEENVSFQECLDYIYDVMFRRTFQGYDREHKVLDLLRRLVSKDVQESSAEWDTKYFIDFYVYRADGRLIGIQLKPETFYGGHYDEVVDIREKMWAFHVMYDADVYILRYDVDSVTGDMYFVNAGVIDALKEQLNV